MIKLTTNDMEGQTSEITESLDELARQGARRMIAAALELEAEQYVQALRHLRDGHGHALVVRNGTSHHKRTVQLGAGSIKIKTPRVNDRRPDHRFTSKILPPYMRRSPRLDEAIPVLYLRGLSTGDFSEALEALVGPEAAGFSATTITRLLKTWQDDYQAWRKRSLKGKEYVYVWADGVYFNIRLEEDRLACLVIVGVLPDGRKEVIALETFIDSEDNESLSHRSTILKDAVDDLLQELDSLHTLASQACAFTRRLNTADETMDGETLEMLNRIDENLLSHKAKDVVGFLAHDFAQGILDEKDSKTTAEEIKSKSLRMYEHLRDSAEYHIGILKSE